MYHSSVRSTTANSGNTALALVAIFSLVLSLFAVVRPAIAFDGAVGPAVPGVVQPGNPVCPAGTTEIKFEGANLVEGQELSVVINDQTVTVTITDVNVAAGTFSFEVVGGLAYVVIAKGGPNGNVYDYRPLGAAHDDGLATPINPKNGQRYGISHLSFCVVPVVASIDVEKSGPAQSKVGDPADYTVTITNDGDVELFIQDVDDTLAGDLTAAVVAECGSLLVDEICVFNYSYTVLADDPDSLVNVVSVTATSGSDGSGMSASDDGTATVNLFQPSIEVTKVADVATALVGDTVTYTVRITNTSSADSPDLDLTVIDDSLEGDLLAECPDLLAAGAYCEFIYTHVVTTDDADPLVNTVSVESNPVGFPNNIDDTATATVDVLMPSVDVEKEGPDLSKATDPALYTVTITNDGDTVIYIDSIDDTLQGDLTDAANVDSSDCGASLAIGAWCEITYTYIVGEDDLDPLENTVTVVANTAADFTGVEVDDTDMFSVELFQPDIEVTKVGDVTEAAVGDDVTYTVTIENTSSADSPDLAFDLISDSLQGDLTDAANYDSSACDATLAAGDSCTIVYTRTILETDASPLVNTVSVESHPEGFPNDIDDSDEFSVVIEEEVEEGSITINKVIDCEECETRTIGYWFNAGASHDDETNALLAELAVADGGDAALVEVDIDGTIYTFATAQDVRDFVAADQQSDDGEQGLSRDGQLLRQYLAVQLNVLLNGEECDLAARMLGDQSVADILLEAEAALAADDEAAEVAAIEKLTAINESDDADENPLACEGTEATPVDGFTFDLYTEAGYLAGDDAIDSGTTSGGGTMTFAPLPFGTYVIVEVGNDLELDCEVVAVLSGGTLNADGSITVTIDEATPDVTLTVVNECETPGEEEEFGEVAIIKDANDPDESFSFSATWDADGFTLVDGGLEASGLLEAGSSVTVTETLSAEQLLAGWSLTDIDCGGAAVTVDGSSVTITVVADTTITCTFTNELEDQPGEGVLELDKVFCVTSGEAGTEFMVFAPVVPGTMSSQRVAEDGQPDEGCWTEDVAFTITGGALSEAKHVTTGDDGILEVALPASETAYVITEDLSGASDEFFVEDGAVTVVLVINWIPEEIGNGTVKVIKLFCETDDAADAGVTFQVEGEDVAVPVLQGCTPGDATFEFGDDTFAVGTDGLAIFTVEVGEYDFAEIAPNAAVYNGTVPVVEGEFTTVIVFNTFVEGEQGGNPGGGGVTPGRGQTPREGTAGGNPLPNTATTPAPGGSLPAMLLALIAVGALAIGGQRMAAEARSRR